MSDRSLLWTLFLIKCFKLEKHSLIRFLVIYLVTRRVIKAGSGLQVESGPASRRQGLVLRNDRLCVHYP